MLSLAAEFQGPYALSQIMNNSPKATPPPQTVRDAEDQRRDDARFFLASIVESSRDSIVTVDFDGIITTWNKAAEQLYGFCANEAIGKQLVQLTFPQDLSEVLGNIEKVKHSQKVEVFDSVRINKSGHEIHLEVSMSPVKDEQGKVVGVSTIARDHSAAKLLEQERDRLLEEHQQARQDAEEAQRKAEEALQDAEEARHQAEEARRQAEEAERFKDRFISIVSHEMRAPLTSMHGWLSLLRSGSLQKSDVRAGLGTIQRGADTLLRLVNDLLDVERIRTGKMQMNQEEVNLHSVIAYAIQAVQPQAEGKSIRLNTKSVSSGCMVSGDGSRLQQVLLNLLSNAIKFTPEGGRVDICIISQGDTVELTVSDTGTGITSEFLPHVFEQFRQADELDRRSHSGLGLGLYIVQDLVRLHGGTIQAESEGEGTGTTFRVRLPLAK
jgi:PAS domain S-box-containing protein